MSRTVTVARQSVVPAAADDVWARAVSFEGSCRVCDTLTFQPRRGFTHRHRRLHQHWSAAGG